MIKALKLPINLTRYYLKKNRLNLNSLNNRVNFLRIFSNIEIYKFKCKNKIYNLKKIKFL